MSGVWERVCPVDAVGADRPVGVVLGDGNGEQDRDRVCVVRTAAGEYVAMLDRCPHRDIRLSAGIVRGDSLVCPGHFWRFDVRTGRRSDLPTVGATVYPTRVVEGWVEALVPPPQRGGSMRQWLLAQARRGGAGTETAPGPGTLSGSP